MPGSPASGTIIAPGDVLRRINGHEIGDVLDYRYASYDRSLVIELTGADGRMKIVRLSKPEGADTGLEFETYLMDTQRSCANKCIFCFIDQLPEGMRETLYYKDDDVRLSFLQGNYVTLTNLSEDDIGRIIRLRISPVNVSVHTLDPELRIFMLGTRNGAAGVDALKSLAAAGIELNCQIVCCPGINDGDRLTETMMSIYALGHSIKSVSVVPVGLTKHREGLMQLRPFDRELALETVKRVDSFGEKCLRRRGSRLFFCADELYIKAGLRFPKYNYYEEFPQLENGVGKMRLFIAEFLEALREYTVRSLATPGPHSGYDNMRQNSYFSIATGTAASKYLTNILKIASAGYGKIKGRVYAVRNDFFGDGVTVSGLVTGGDIIARLRGRELGTALLIPQNMLRSGDDVFLDDTTVAEVSEALGVPVRVVGPGGADLLSAIFHSFPVYPGGHKARPYDKL